MIGLPPGNILQYIYLKKRLRLLKKENFNSFIEIGSGNGNVSKIFLELGFRGTGFDLNESACINNKTKNKSFIDSKTYEVFNEDFLLKEEIPKVDVIISCMVIEHMPENVLNNYFNKCKEMLKSGGRIITLVPSSMRHWGIEDEIAGHYKRYEFDDFKNISQKFDLSISNMSGLTYPISNIVFNLSNKLIKKNEIDKLDLSQEDKTIYTGNRNVKFKTTFPPIFNLILNPVVLYPFYILQNIFRKNKNSMVIYNEFQKN